MTLLYLLANLRVSGRRDLPKGTRMKRQIIATGQILIIFLFTTRGFFITSVPVQSTAEPPVVINELMWMGSSVSSSDEWIELKNHTDQPIDISSWYLTKKSGGSEVIMVTIADSVFIDPNEYFLISNYPADSVNSTLNVDPDLIDTSVSLVNSGLQIKLYDSENNLIDAADDGIGRPLAGVYESGQAWKSMERNAEYEDGTLETSWHTADSSYNFDPGSDEFGTPRWINTDPNQPPIAKAGEDQTVLINETVYFDGSDSFDPDNDWLAYNWNFGDSNGAGSATPTHTYAEAGEYNVLLTVTDGNDESSDDLRVTVENPEPIDVEPSPELDEEIEYPQTVKINELLPNPEGSDSEYEFIELYNSGTSDIDLVDWILSDASRKYIIKSDDLGSTIIESGGYFVFPRTISKIALNNSSPETVTLADPNGNISDEVYYEPPVPEGRSYNLSEGKWCWSNILTPNKKNIIEQSEDPPEKDAPDETNLNPEPDTKETEILYDFSELILITELLPNPEGPDAEEEFIEIANFDNKEISLLGWELTDTKAYFEITEPLLIAPGEYLTFGRTDTKIALNNSSEQVFLIDPSENIVSGVYYSKAKEGLSWSRIENSDNWAWSTIMTPEKENTIEVIEEEAEEETSAESKNETIEINLSQIRNLPTRQSIKTQGVVVVQPGILGKQLFYINNSDSGIQIYSSESDFPELNLGDLVEVTGTIGESQGEKKINTKSALDINVIGQSDMPEPLFITGVDLDEKLEGRLVKIEGDILTKQGQTLTIDSGGEEVTIYLKKTTGIKASDYKEGDAITTIGLISQTKSGYRVLPRSPEDILKSVVLGASTESSDIDEEIVALDSDNNRQRTLIYLFSTLGVLFIGSVAYYWKNKIIKKRGFEPNKES